MSAVVADHTKKKKAQKHSGTHEHTEHTSDRQHAQRSHSSQHHTHSRQHTQAGGIADGIAKGIAAASWTGQTDVRWPQLNRTQSVRLIPTCGPPVVALYSKKKVRVFVCLYALT